MQKRAKYHLFAGLLACAPLTTLPGTVARAECLKAPNHQPHERGHWYYRFDRANHRQCWYLVRPDVASTPTAVASAPTPTSPMQLLQVALAPDTRREGADEQAQSVNPPRPQTRTAEPLASDATAAPTKLRHPHRWAAANGADGPLGRAKRDELFRKFTRWVEERKDQVKQEELFREFLRWRMEQSLPTTGTVTSEKLDSP